MKIKIVIGVVAILVLMTGAQNAYAAPAFQTGFNHGVSDARIPNDPARGYYGAYINQTGKGFDHHSAAFNEGYTRGWCEVKGYDARLYPHANSSLAPDFRCSDVLGMSLIFSLGDDKNANGVPCTFGPHHDECEAQFLDRIRSSSAYQSGVKNGDYQSGYNHGVADANVKEPECAPHQFPCPPPIDYILQPGQGFADHTTAFVDGYMKGWCSMNPGHSGIDVNDEPEPTIAAFDCDDGLISATPNPSDWPN